jgi:hypothetical protein
MRQPTGAGPQTAEGLELDSERAEGVSEYVMDLAGDPRPFLKHVRPPRLISCQIPQKRLGPGCYRDNLALLAVIPEGRRDWCAHPRASCCYQARARIVSMSLTRRSWVGENAVTFSVVTPVSR